MRPAALLCIWLLAAPVWGQQPTPVSPGSGSGRSRIEARCPTFSWSPAAGAAAHEIVVYELEGAESDLEGAARRLLISLPGAASSWTPSWEDCLEPGKTFAWAVRATAGDRAGRWSEPFLFEILSRPDAEEVRAALELVRRIRGLRPPAGADAAAGLGRLPQDTAAATGPAGPASEQVPAESPGLSIDGVGNVVGNAFIHWCGADATEAFYPDGDGDSYPSEEGPVQACTQPPGFVAFDEFEDTFDCDDLRAHRNLECLCDRFNPAADCHSPDATRCVPSLSPSPPGIGLCLSIPVGSGGQGDPCTETADCGAELVCEDFLYNTCLQWCRVLGDDCPAGTSCTSAFIPYYIGTTEWSVCLDDEL